MGHSTIHVTFDTYGYLFPGRGKEASERYEKSMETARLKSGANVSNPLAIESEDKPRLEASSCRSQNDGWWNLAQRNRQQMLAIR